MGWDGVTHIIPDRDSSGGQRQQRSQQHLPHQTSWPRFHHAEWLRVEQRWKFVIRFMAA